VVGLCHNYLIQKKPSDESAAQYLYNQMTQIVECIDASIHKFIVACMNDGMHRWLIA
jgi:hypothetical protein